MRLRARHFACLLLLLSSLGSADAAALRAGSLTPGGRYIASVLQQAAQREAAESTLSLAEPRSEVASTIAVPAARRVWTMAPPAAHTAAIHSLTSVPALRS